MKNELDKWNKEINEVSNGVWKITLTHKLGPSIEKTGENLDQLEKDVEMSAIEMNKQIEKI